MMSNFQSYHKKYIFLIILILTIITILATKYSRRDGFDTNNSQIPIIEAQSYTTIEDGFKRTKGMFPFIVHNAKEFNYLSQKYVSTEIRKNPHWKVSATNEMGEKVYDLVLKELLDKFYNDTLNFQVFDTPLHMFDLPKVLKKNHIQMEFEKDDETYILLNQTPVLSRANYLTPWHMDPINLGGGWMYIFQGEKDWYFNEPWMAPLYYDENTSLIQDLTLTDYHSILSNYDFKSIKGFYPEFQVSPFLTAKARPGDFVYFPPGWIHRVKTHNKTIGIGGYIRLPTTLEKSKKVSEYFTHFGINGTWNE
jgi:Cupin-like domain